MIGSGLLRGALLGLAAWAAIGLAPALMLAPAAALAGGLERWGARGGWRRLAVILGTAPLCSLLALSVVLQGLYLRTSLASGPLPAGRLVAEVFCALPADPNPVLIAPAQAWLGGLPWWRSNLDVPTYALLGTATLVGGLLGLLNAGRLLLGVGPWRTPDRPGAGEEQLDLQVRLPGLVTLTSTVGACGLGVLWAALFVPEAPHDPDLQGPLSLWGFAVVIGMAAPLAWSASDVLAGFDLRRR